MPQSLDRFNHKPRILEISRDPILVIDIEMTTTIGRTTTTATKTTGATMTTVGIMTTAGETSTTEVTITAEAMTIAPTTITVVTRSTIGRMTIVGTITVTVDNRGTTKGTTGRKMYARSDGIHPTTIGGGPAPQGLNHRCVGAARTEIGTSNTDEHRQR